MTDATYQLGVLAKFWEPGKVKTRLAATIGNRPAAAVYEVFVQWLMARLCEMGGTREVVFDPEDRATSFEKSAGENRMNWTFCPQGDGDLGTRMQRFFHRHLSRGRAAVLIGSDSPTLPRQYIDQAGMLLKQYSVVLGPSDDGGYYLIAAKGELPPIFSGINWSSQYVWRQTTDRLKEQGISYGVVPSWYDVDSESDLRRLLQEIDEDGEFETLRDGLRQVMHRGQSGDAAFFSSD